MNVQKWWYHCSTPPASKESNALSIRLFDSSSPFRRLRNSVSQSGSTLETPWGTVGSGMNRDLIVHPKLYCRRAEERDSRQNTLSALSRGLTMMTQIRRRLLVQSVRCMVAVLVTFSMWRTCTTSIFWWRVFHVVEYLSGREIQPKYQVQTKRKPHSFYLGSSREPLEPLHYIGIECIRPQLFGVVRWFPESKISLMSTLEDSYQKEDRARK